MADEVNPFARFGQAEPANPFAKYGQVPQNPFAKYGTSFEDQSFVQRNLTTPLATGTASMRAGSSMIGYSKEQEKLLDLERLDNARELERNARAEAARTGQEFFPGTNPTLSKYDALLEPEIHRYAFTDNPKEKEAIRELLTERAREHSRLAADQMAKLSTLPRDEAFDQALQSGDWKTIGSALAENPMRVWRLSLESGPQMAGAVALTPLLGPAVGSGLTSMSAEMGQALITGMMESGYNPYDSKSIEAFFNDPAALAKAKEVGKTRGVVVGAFDALSGGLASKMLVPKKLVQGGLKREAANIGVNLPVQAGLGGGGEAAAQLAVSGKITSPGDIFAEAIGELGGTPMEVVGLGLASGRYKDGKLPSPDVNAPISNRGLEDIIKKGEETSVPKLSKIEGTETPPEGPGNPPAGPGDHRPVNPKEGKPTFTIEDLPENAFDIKKENGYEGSDEALKAARAASRSAKRATMYTSQGLHEFAMKEKKNATEALGKAIALGFRPPSAPTTPKTPNTPGINIAGFPGWAVAGKIASRGKEMAFRETPEGLVLRVAYSKEHGGWVAYATEPGESPDIPSGYKDTVFKSADKAIKKIEEIYEKVRTKTETPPVTPPVTPPTTPPKAGLPTPPALPKPTGWKQKPLPIQESKKRWYVQGDVSVRPYASFVTKEEAVAKADELNALRKPGDIKSEAYTAREIVGSSNPYDENIEAPNLKQLVSLGLSPAQTVSSLPRSNPGYWRNFYPTEMDELREGTVRVKALYNGTTPTKQELAFEKWLNIVAKRFTPGMKFVLDMRSNAPGMDGTKKGHFAAERDGIAFIGLNVSLGNNELNMWKTLNHEFGHAIMFWHWYKADPTVHQAVYQAFQRWMNKHRGIDSTSKAPDLWLDFWGWPEVGNWVRYADENEDSSKTFELSSVLNSWFNFDEFMAEQIARFFVTNKKTTSVAGRFFKGVALALKNTWHVFYKSRAGAKMEAEPEIGSWLLDIMKRRGEREMPITPEASIHGLQEAIETNREYKDQPVSEIVMPQAENHYLHAQAKNLNVPKKAVVQQDRYTYFLRFWPNLLQLADKNPHITGLQRYLEFTRQWMNEKMEIISRADTTVKAWRKLGKEQGQKLSDFLFELEEMTYLKKGENARWPTQQELLGIAQRLGLTAKDLDVYFMVKNDFLDVLDRIESAWIKDAQRSFKDPALLAQNIFNIKTEMNALRSKPYFPHARFGDFVVTVYGPKGGIKHSEHFDTAKQADKGAAALRARFAGNKVTIGKLSEEVKIFQGLPPTLLKQMALKVRNLTGAQLDDIEKLVFAMSPANSFAKHFSKRKGTPGYSTDGLRAYANYFLHAGGHIARIKWRADLQESVDEVERSARALGVSFSASAVDKRQGIADWMKRHLEYIMNPPNEWTALRSLAFFWHLGLNASSALVNLTQIPMVAYPYLAARYGDVGAVNQLRKAAADLPKMYGLKQTLSQDERDAIDLGVRQGFLDESQNADLAGASQHGVLGRIVPGNALERGRMALAHWSSAAFQAIEKWNRRIVFRAAYRLAKTDPQNKYVQQIILKNQMMYQDLLGKGWMPENAGAFLAARDAIEKSQFNYSSYARPEFIRGKKGVLFAFWMFKQNMLYFYKNDPGAIRGLLILGMTAGLMGMPGAEDLALMLKYASRAMFGKDFDVEREARALIIELAGEGGLSKDSARRTADLIMLGLGRESFGMAWAGEGLGIPMPAFDVSNRLGMGSIVPGIKPALEGLAGERKFGDSIGEMGIEIAGASYGIPLAMLRAVESGDLDEAKTWERLMPTAAKNLARAMRIAREGKETSRSGATLADVDITDSQQLAEVVGMALGFTPTRLSTKWDVLAEQKEVISYWRIQRQLIFEAFDKARLTKDREAMADVKEALRRFNREAPDKRLKISLQDILQSSKQRQLNRTKMEQGKALQKTYSGVSSAVGDLYPSTTSSKP